MDFQVHKDDPKLFKKLGLWLKSQIMNRTIILWL